MEAKCDRDSGDFEESAGRMEAWRKAKGRALAGGVQSAAELSDISCSIADRCGAGPVALAAA